MIKPTLTDIQSKSEMKKPFTIPSVEIARRQLSIQKALQVNRIDGLFIVQRVDLFYFTGTAQNGFLFMPAQGEPLLFIKRYWPRARQESPHTILDKVKPGITVGELFQISVETAESLGYTVPYLGPPGYKVAFIGHGVGLELIEPPVIANNKDDRLEPGMTLALEPKMVFHNEFAAGVESVFLVTDQGARLISQVPAEVFIC